jgi:hypothetical protein
MRSCRLSPGLKLLHASSSSSEFTIRDRFVSLSSICLVRGGLLSSLPLTIAPSVFLLSAVFIYLNLLVRSMSARVGLVKTASLSLRLIAAVRSVITASLRISCSKPNTSSDLPFRSSTRFRTLTVLSRLGSLAVNLPTR